MRKIIAEATGTKTETKMPPILEFFGPENLKVIVITSTLSTRGQNGWDQLLLALLSSLLVFAPFRKSRNNNSINVHISRQKQKVSKCSKMPNYSQK